MIDCRCGQGWRRFTDFEKSSRLFLLLLFRRLRKESDLKFSASNGNSNPAPRCHSFDKYVALILKRANVKVNDVCNAEVQNNLFLI